jgi:two-component system NtrC family sensor kinase
MNNNPLRYLSFRLFLAIVGVMLVVFAIHTYLDVRTISDNMTDQVYSSASQASDIIVRSTRYGMQLNRKEDVHQIIRTIGNEPGFDEINIYNKTGEIIFSTDSLRIGTTVDLQAEACVACHQGDAPLTSAPTDRRVRVYEPSGGRGPVLGLINAIRNEPECSNAACHAHSPDQTVLGVLDVKMSLAGVTASVAHARRQMITSAMVMILLIAGVSGFYIYRAVRQPIRKIRRGMNKISSGDLDARIEIERDDELGALARTFNRMAADLSRARGELEGWTRTLEDRVAQKSQELQDAQNQMIQMEKMASLGKLSASVAHEINNPLFSILTYAKLILAGAKSDELDENQIESIRKCATVIKDESSRCGDIVKGLLDFARQTGGRFERHRLSEILERTLVVLKHHFEMRQIQVETEFDTEHDDLMCDARQIQQAVIAPCINAVEAMDEGGTLTIHTRGDQENVVIEITDNGVGIEPDALDRIFEPFFTTKEGEAGLGLGLAVTYGVVQRHQGKIEVESEPNQGTTVRITLPKEPVMEEQNVSA